MSVTELIINVLHHWKPMQVLDNWRYVVIFTRPRGNACCKILYGL